MGLLAGLCFLLAAGPGVGSLNFDTAVMGDLTRDWSGVVSGRMHKPRCLDIPDNLTICKNVGYTKMRLPNLLDHDSLPEVIQQAAFWKPLIGRRCNADSQLFLCSLFTPVCLDRLIHPCRSLCEVVKRGCEASMKTWGYPWPDMLRCDKFPEDNDLCIPPQHTPGEDNVCHPCKEPDTFEGLVDNYCRADAVFRVRIKKVKKIHGYMKIKFRKKKRAYKKGPLKKKEIRKLTGYITNGDTCDCDKDNTTLVEQKKRLLVMGRKEGKRFIILFLSPYQRKSDSFRKAVRAWKKNDMCKGGIRDIYDPDPSKGEEAAQKKKKGKKNSRGEKRKGSKKKRKDKNKRKKKGKKGNKDPNNSVSKMDGKSDDEKGEGGEDKKTES